MKLSKFLKENNVYSKFIYYSLKDSGTINSVKQCTLGEIDIRFSFYWKETAEGEYFWEELASKFDNLKDKIYDMDEVLYEEYSKKENTIKEEPVELKESEDKILTLNGKRYKLVPIEEEESLDEISIIKEKYKSGNYIAIRLKDNKWELCDQDYKENFRGSSSIKLIKKEHRDILEAYLKDNVKIEYRWYDEPWMVLEGDFIENYDENMQLRKVKKEFKPFTLNIEVNSLNDLKSLLNRFNLGDCEINELLPRYGIEPYSVYSEIDMEIWKFLDYKLAEFE